VFAVYVYLASRADRKWKCWPSRETIAKDLGLSLDTVKRCIRVLLQLKAIEIEHVLGKSSVYHLTGGTHDPGHP